MSYVKSLVLYINFENNYIHIKTQSIEYNKGWNGIDYILNYLQNDIYI